MIITRNMIAQTCQTVALCVLAVAGCDVAPDEEPIPDRSKPRPLAQLKGGGCIQGFELFDDGKCHMRYDCETASDCLAGLECFAGYCVGPSCKTDNDCPSKPWKWICHMGQCVDAACKVDTDCGEASRCNAGHCYDGCEPDCPKGKTCVDGLCL